MVRRWHCPLPCAAPPIITPSQNITQFIGEEAFLYCEAEGPPPPLVAWSRLDNTSLPTNHDLLGSTLRVYSLSLEDTGGYLCTATNSLGTDEAVTWLSVVGESGVVLEGKDNFPLCFTQDIGSVSPTTPTRFLVACGSHQSCCCILPGVVRCALPPVLVCLPRVPLQRGQQWRSSRLRCLW